MRLVTVTTGKSRKISSGVNAAWVKAEATIEFDSDDDEEVKFQGIKDLLAEVEQLLLEQEESEHERWDEIKNQLRQLKDR